MGIYIGKLGATSETLKMRRSLTIVVLSMLLLSLMTLPHPSVNASGGFIELPQGVFTKLQRAVDVTWNGNGFIGSDRANLSSAKLVSISTDGKTVTPFAPSFSTNNGSMEDYVALSQGKAGFPSGYYFVLSFDSIYKIDPSGNSVELFSTPLKSQQLSFIAFDSVGTWGYSLLALYMNGMIWSINSTGGASEVADVGSRQNPECITVAPTGFGNFGGNLIVSEEIGNHSIVAISQTSKGLTFLARFPAEAPERVFPVVSNEDLYIGKYDQGLIEKFPASDFANFSSSSLLVITEGENGQNGSIDVLTAKGNNVTSIPILLENATHFEGMTYAPENLNSLGTSTVMNSNTASPNAASSLAATANYLSTTTLIIVALVVVALVVAITLVIRRRS